MIGAGLIRSYVVANLVCLYLQVFTFCLVGFGTGSDCHPSPALDDEVDGKDAEESLGSLEALLFALRQSSVWCFELHTVPSGRYVLHLLALVQSFTLCAFG